MSVLKRLKMLYRLVCTRGGGDTHAERVENFYREQASQYDETRPKMLHGRKDLIAQIPLPESAIWVELGAGTGSNLELLGERVASLQKAHLVDLSPSILTVARDRIEKNRWTNVEVHQADATSFDPAQRVDVVLCSYSLTMIPDWFAAIDNAKRLLKPTGVLAVVDYYVSRNHPTIGTKRHSWTYRTYAPTLFEKNNVHPSPDHIDYLHHHFEPMHFSEHMGKAYGRWLDVAYYRFIGKPKPAFQG
jgi:S-adenosylmethionine-diacylgycerolhomoserine-N-methlytransferase